MLSASSLMRAIVHDRYGSLDSLRLRDIPIPAVTSDEVLVRIRAAGLQIADCFAVRGSPFPVRAVTGILRPKHGIPGLDCAGEVVAVGSRVKDFRPGDEVFGTCSGSCAEFAAAPEATLVSKPANLTWEQAAAIPTAALAGLHGIRDAGHVQPGQKVLIIGASGGVGTFAVQLANLTGAEVTAVCSGRNADLVRSLGACDVIDYTREDFADGSRSFDVILDNIENRSLADCRRSLKPGGTLVLNSGTGATGLRFWARLMKPLLLSPFANQKLRRYFSEPNRADLEYLSGLLRTNRLVPIVEKVYPLSETITAMRGIEGGIRAVRS